MPPSHHGNSPAETTLHDEYTPIAILRNRPPSTSLRDLTEYGDTLAFDDAENLSGPRKTDPDRRALLLAGAAVAAPSP